MPICPKHGIVRGNTCAGCDDDYQRTIAPTPSDALQLRIYAAAAVAALLTRTDLDLEFDEISTRAFVIAASMLREQKKRA